MSKKAKDKKPSTMKLVIRALGVMKDRLLKMEKRLEEDKDLKQRVAALESQADISARLAKLEARNVDAR